MRRLNRRPFEKKERANVRTLSMVGFGFWILILEFKFKLTYRRIEDTDISRST